jgi:signal transduction histidine kinase
MLKKGIILFAIVFVCGFGFSQSFNYGLPLLNNYGTQDYEANNDNWAIEQDNRGIMYFGNSAGLLEFDGHHWKNFAPGVFAYDMKKSANGVIYVAIDNDFGYIGFKENGETEYVSLLQKELKTNEYIGTFYTVEIVGDIVYFLTNRGFLFKWNNKKLERIKLPQTKTSRYKTLRHLNDKFYIQSPDGFAELLNDSIPKTLPHGEYFKNISIEEMFEIGDDSLMLVTRLHGLFLYSNNQLRPMNSNGSDFAKKNQVYVADQIDKDNIVLGTVQKGVLVIDKAGNIRYNLNREAGMISNDHCEIFIDRNKNIWSALENGITNISRNSPFTQIPEQYNIPLAKVYSMIIHNNNFYVGTAQGTYYANMSTPANKLRFDYVEGTGARKILDIIEIENEYIITASGTGVFSTRKNKANQITKRTFNDLEVFDKNHIVGALFKGGLGVLKKKNNSWYLHKNFTVYPGLSYLNIDRNKQLWFIEDKKRMIRAKLNKQYDNILSYEEVTGIPDNISFDSVSIFQLNNQILMGTKSGTFKFVNNKFEPYTELNNAFGEPVFINKIKYDHSQKIWFIGSLQNDAVLGKIDFNRDGSIAVKQFKTTLHRLDDYTISMFYPYDDENVFIGTSERIIHFNTNYNHIADNQFPTHIRSVEIISSRDSIIFGGVYKDENKTVLRQPQNNIPELKFNNNALRFKYAGIFYDESKNTTFQYKLEGYDDRWSDWTSTTTKEYNFLSEGDYQFNVRAKNVYGVVSNIDSYRFSIAPPWSRTILAYVVYMAFLSLLVYAIIKYQTRRLKRENIRLENIVAERTEEILSQKKEIEDHNQVLSQKNKEISLQTEQLKESNQVKDQLFSIISHDLRSPMLSLISWVEMAKDQTISEAVFREHIDKLAERLGQTREITENLLNWANSQMKGYKVNKESFVINELVNDKIAFYKDQSSNKGINLLNNVSDKLEMFADRDMIDLVLRNLVTNAIKFSKSGDSITINATVSGQNVVVSIEDTGIGIAPENIPKLFGKKFYTTFGTQKEQGSGLGLKLCKDFVELNGGKIWVESVKNIGSTFYFSVPVE